jgi:two-component system NtrC family sensor kinase
MKIMKKFIISIFCTSLLMHTYGQDYTLDSLHDALTGSKTDAARITALQNLSEFYFNGYSWVDLKKKDTSFLLLKEAIRIAEENKLNGRQEELLQELAFRYYSSNTNEKDSIASTALHGLALARSANLKIWEAIFSGWASVGYFLTSKRTDSALLLMRQGLAIARKNRLDSQEVMLLDYFGKIYSDPKPDSAGLLFRQSLRLAIANKLTFQQIDILRDLANLYADRNNDSALFWMHKALTLAKQNNFRKAEITILYPLMGTWSALYEDDSLDQNFNLGMELARQIHSQHSESDFLNNYGTVQANRGDYSKSLAAYLKALDIKKQTDDKFGIASTLYNIGNLYLNVQDYARSLLYLSQANELSKKIKDSFDLTFSLVGIGNAYVKLKEYDSARIFAQMAYKVANLFYGGHVYGGLLNNIGQIYTDLGDDSVAMFYFRQSFRNFNVSNEDENICESLIGMANLFKKSRHSDSAFYYATRAFPIAKKNKFLQYIWDASSLMADHYKSRHLIDSAFKFQGIALIAHDSLFSQEKLKELERIDFESQMEQHDLTQKLLQAGFQYENRLRTSILIGGLIIFFMLAVGLWRKNVYKQKAYAVLDGQKKIIDLQKAKVEQTLEELKLTQAQLIQSEKMASLGGLTAGIAHEIENPLNFVNNFSEVNSELVDELEQELKAGKIDNAIAISKDIKENEQKINYHGKRADAIVKSMLQHSRSSTGQKELININAIADECLKLCYHSIRSKDKTFQANLQTDFDRRIDKMFLIPQDLVRVSVNLFNNAFYAVNEKSKLRIRGYEPTVFVSTLKTKDKIEIRVKDNGNGISQKVVDKIFQPFFTTKPTGQGTGLGLSLSYDIIKAHGGEIQVNTKEGEFAEFMIRLPAS